MKNVIAPEYGVRENCTFFLYGNGFDVKFKIFCKYGTAQYRVEDDILWEARFCKFNAFIGSSSHRKHFPSKTLV